MVGRFACLLAARPSSIAAIRACPSAGFLTALQDGGRIDGARSVIGTPGGHPAVARSCRRCILLEAGQRAPGT
jgi:hypothetical protein